MANEDVHPIDLTFQRSSAPLSSPDTYICPICSEEQFTLDHFITHMTKHRWDKPLSLSQEYSWLLLTKSSAHKNSRRIKILRRSRRRQRDLRRSSYSAANVDSKQLVNPEIEDVESFLCPACPAFQKIVGVKAAVVRFY